MADSHDVPQGLDTPIPTDQLDTGGAADGQEAGDTLATQDHDGADDGIDGAASDEDAGSPEDMAPDSQDSFGDTTLDAATDTTSADDAGAADAPADSPGDLPDEPDAEPQSIDTDSANQDVEVVAGCKAADLAALQCSGAGVCAGSVPTCQDGSPACNYATLQDYQETETACDGLDNDCDGQTDWMAAAPPKAPLPGVCGLQLMVCGGKAGWLLPNPLMAPAFQANETLCDGLDNDCDGLTDAGLTKANSNALGVCAMAPLQCDQGLWVLPDYPSANIAYQATETACDGLDNDCDGLTDSLAGPPPPASLSKGVCAGQVKWCAGDLGWQDPDPALVAGYAMGPETTCDSQDNDCDGLTDEDAACPRWQQGGGGPGRLALAANGQVLAWLTHAGVRWLDTTTGEVLGADLGRAGYALDVAVTPNGKQVATAGEGEVLRTVAGDGAAAAPGTWPTLQSWTATAPWSALAWAPDSATLVAGDTKGGMWWWPADEATPLPLAGHATAVTAVAIASSAGQGATWLVSGDAGGQVRSRPWPAGAVKTVATLPGSVARIAVDIHGRIAVTAADQPAQVFSLASGMLQYTLAAGESIASVRFAADGLSAWGVGASGTLYQWSTPLAGSSPSLPWTQSVQGPAWDKGDHAGDLAVGPGHFYVAAASSGLWRRALVGSTWQHLGGGHLGEVRALATSGPLALSAGNDGLVRRFHASGAAASPLLGHEGPVLCVAGWPTGVVSAGADFTVRLWDTADPSAPINFKTFGLGGPWASDLAIAGDAQSFWAAAGSAAVRVGIQGVNLAKKLQAWPSSAPVVRIALAPGDAQLAVATAGPGSAAGYRALNAATLTQAWERTDLSGSERALVWAGDRIALAGGPARLVLVDPATGATVQELAGHQGEVTGLAWHAASQRLLSASADGTVRIWSAPAGKPAKLLGTWTRHSPKQDSTLVRTVAWLALPGGGEPLALSASADGAVMAWTAPQ